MSSSSAVVPVVSMLLQPAESSLHERYRQSCTCYSAFVSGKNRGLILKFNCTMGLPAFDVNEDVFRIDALTMKQSCVHTQGDEAEKIVG
ncbi:hypothetical protein C4D60_Mb06t10060 [Musa balbisiana]|uniref:Uncharacterized protein n=1 Tax=Musa balbisiana TaxID=52838 RepID=A0A4S8ILZ8_MUSBA|nr:hypothetical protein C4D60_Mb06t10060 [Musa balbisiana]